MRIDYDKARRDRLPTQKPGKQDEPSLNLALLADELDAVPREGEESDQPEGARFVKMSDTLARRIAAALRGPSR